MIGSTRKGDIMFTSEFLASLTEEVKQGLKAHSVAEWRQMARKAQTSWYAEECSYNAVLLEALLAWEKESQATA